MSRRDFIMNHHAASYPFISPLSLDLAGRSVLITGAAHADGVGFATALAFARAGASVICIADIHPIAPDRSAELVAAALEAGRPEPTIVATTVDISSRDSVAALVSTYQATSTHLDVLVNNAAHQEPYLPLLEADPDVYWRTWEVNVGGLISMARASLPLLFAAPERRGTMINLSSSGALSVRAGSASYRTSKLAVLRWTEALHMEHAPHGLLAFCVNPGAIRTQMTVNEPESVRAMLPHKPEIAGDTIAWLAAKRLEWLGGRYVSCPWDMEELLARKDEIVEGDKLKLKLVM